MGQFEQYLLKSIECGCGKSHKTEVKDILIEEGAIRRIPEIILNYGYRNVIMVADRNTYLAAGEKVVDLCGEHSINLNVYVFGDDSLVPDEEAVGKLVTAIPLDCDLILAVGTGTVNDLCRYVSHRLHMDYFVVATAPSMDGFASTVAPLIVNHMKKTFPAKAPIAVIGDVSIMKHAPMELIRAGIGDILGKYTSLCDWKLSHMVTGEYYCDYLADMVREAVRKVADHVEGIPNRETEAVTAVMEALVLSGIAMAFAGNSRPASGSEHHLAHYWEILFLLQNRHAVLHGTKVGIGTVIVRGLYDKLQKYQVDFEEARKKAKEFDQETWDREVKLAYGEELGEQVVALEREAGKNDPVNVLERINKIQGIFPEIIEMIQKELPDTETIVRIMKTIHAPIHPEEIQVDEQMIGNGIHYAKDIRNRYGLFQLLFDLGWR